MRPPMFHLRFARSFVRFTAKTPQAAPSQRLPKRCTTHGRRRRTATNPKRLRNVMRGLSRFTPIALRLRLRATERRKAAPEVPPAAREVAREAHGEDAAGSPAPEEAEALHLSEALGC